LIPLWFILITILWTGFFVLEGFDFGVGILHNAAGRDEASRRTAINTIGPLWDGNEVWLVVAAAAMFAAFPAWYATLFSGFYLVVVLLLVALIVRGISFEYRGKRESARWRRTWDLLMTAGSLVAPFLIGLTLGDLLHGVPINRGQQFSGTLTDLFQPYAIYAGLTLVGICVLHGATFLALKTAGDVHDRAARLSRRVAPVTGIAVLAFVAWTHASSGKGALLNPVELAAVVAAFAAAWFVYDRREGWAFTATTVTMAASVLSIFVDLYPRVMVSSTSPAFDLTVRNTASGPYSLEVMTVVALIALPFVLGYQAWTYYVFRRRISSAEFRRGPDAAPRPGTAAFAATSSAVAMPGADPPGSGSAVTGSPATDSAGPRSPRSGRTGPAGAGQAGQAGDRQPGQAGDGQAGDRQAGQAGGGRHRRGWRLAQRRRRSRD
jgi:cytochrome d ubiquinol oxidase subunit II